MGAELRVKSLRISINKDIPQSQCNLAAAKALTEPCAYETQIAAARR